MLIRIHMKFCDFDCCVTNTSLSIKFYWLFQNWHFLNVNIACFQWNTLLAMIFQCTYLSLGSMILRWVSSSVYKILCLGNRSVTKAKPIETIHERLEASRRFWGLQTNREYRIDTFLAENWIVFWFSFERKRNICGKNFEKHVTPHLFVLPDYFFHRELRMIIGNLLLEELSKKFPPGWVFLRNLLESGKSARGGYSCFFQHLCIRA